MDILRTVVVIEHLAGMRKPHLDVFPYPFGSIGHHTESHGLFGNQACCTHLLECLSQVVLILDLMPTQQMDNAIAIEEIETKTLGIAPLPTPQRPLGPFASSPRTALPCTVGPRRHIGPINAQHDHRTPPPARGYCGHASHDLLARWRHI